MDTRWVSAAAIYDACFIPEKMEPVVNPADFVTLATTIWEESDTVRNNTANFSVVNTTEIENLFPTSLRLRSLLPLDWRIVSFPVPVTSPLLATWLLKSVIRSSTTPEKRRNDEMPVGLDRSTGHRSISAKKGLQFLIRKDYEDISDPLFSGDSQGE